MFFRTSLLRAIAHKMHRLLKVQVRQVVCGGENFVQNKMAALRCCRLLKYFQPFALKFQQYNNFLDCVVDAKQTNKKVSRNHAN